MEKNNVRYRLRARKRKLEAMTLVEIMAVMVIMAIIATAAAVTILPTIKKSKIKQTSADAKVVASAAEMYLSENDDCPNVEKLVSEKILAKGRNTKDAWDHDFEIECNEDGATVRSSGPDEQMGTEDDIQ